ncbi:GTPase IMAP family member 8-like isoform X23 [Oncorhynchus keta]|uniref:GTPase IMAP family member 8-like isoform X21 n=1 Tax=Oncorhynchus keta TaxID=8018 RepID=UPI00227AD7B1|nr:GTPase IMAP family member 8-like isoform X21 [Oncorhynchus keta]XP_052359071.1 GTPase IMAP family member 8-like isoform X22 [Oncorhynchus keta]XP_052359072.1 GTPase IMAP family member 8-like isoform X23 [Oncorhynchus keta]
MRKDRCCHNRLIEVRRVTQERQAGSERLGSSERRKEKTQGYRQKTQQPVPTNSYLAMTDVLPGSHARTPEPELRLVLLGTIGCGKTLSGDTLLGQSSSGSPSSSGSSPRLCQLRPGASEGRRLTVVEAPRWYWSGGHMEAGVRKETERVLELAAPGPHAFLLLVPVGQFTEVEHRVPAELEEVFGEGVLKHTLVLFTCGDYLMGQGAGQYLEGEDPGLREVIDRCGGQYHVLNNRRPQDREQVRELLEKVEDMVQKNRGCYIRQNTLQREMEEQGRERERELKEKVEEQGRGRERELKEKVEEQARGRERELKEKVEEQARGRERELKEKVEEQARGRERELKEKVEEQARGRERELKEKVEEQARGRERELESRRVTNTETRRYWGNRKREVTPNSVIERRREEEREVIKRRREEMERKREEEIERRREEGEDMEEKVTVKPLVNCLQSTPAQQQQSKKTQNGGPALFTRIPSFHLTEEGDILSQLSEIEAKPAQKVVNTFCHRINSIGEKTTTSSSSQSELRVVLLGRSGSGKSAAGNIILGREEFVSRPDITTAVTQDCQKSRALVAGRRVAVVDTPDWFRSEHPPDVVRSQLSSCVALSAPGPHAFILCVPVDQPAQAELQALGALEKVFGPGAVRTHTLVLFTHSDRLKESGKVGVEGVEKYISSQRRDLLELVKRCGDRYHVMERGSGGEGEEERKRRSVGELLDKVEQTVREGGGECFSCPLFQEAEDRVRQRQEEIVRGRGEEVKRQALHSYSMQPLRETEEDEEENERTREEAEKSVSALELENLPSLSSSPAWYSSLLRSVWEKVGAGASKVPKLTAGGALLGGVVGVFFGGPIGGAIGATAGSVVTEVGRRRFSQTKNSAEETDATGRIEGEILDKVLKTE